MSLTGTVPEKAANAAAPLMPIPAFSDIGKAANDLLNKDFYHAQQASLDVKLRALNGTNINVKGKQAFDSTTSGSIEAKHLIKERGLTITQNVTTGNLFDSKIEIVDAVTPGLKIDLQNIFHPSKGVVNSQKINLAYKNPNLHGRVFTTHSTSDNNINAVVDLVAGHEGFLVGAEAGYDLGKAAITQYSLGVGYQTPLYSASIMSTQNLQVIAASFYQKVNTAVEVSAKAGYDVQGAKPTGLELASKYKLDPLSFAKAKINDRGIAALAYSTKLNAGTTLGLGLSLDTNKLNEAGHKIGTSLTFEG